jgi:hypothetical protein
MSSFIGRKQVRNLNAAPHRSLVTWIQNAYDEVDRLRGIIQIIENKILSQLLLIFLIKILKVKLT